MMEEEYRMQKAQGDMQQALKSATTNSPGQESDVGSAIIHEDGTVIRPSEDDNASTKAVMEAPSPKLSATESESTNGNRNATEPQSMIPTIRISTESLRTKETTETQATKVEDEEAAHASQTDKGKGKAKAEDNDDPSDDEEEEHVKAANGNGQPNGVASAGLEKPTQAAGEGAEQNINEASPAPAKEPFSFSTKRLCERWLDNLFMVLYEVRGHVPSYS